MSFCCSGTAATRLGTEAASATLYNTAPVAPFAVTVCVVLLQWNGSNETWHWGRLCHLYNTAPVVPFAVTVCVVLLQWNGSNESQILLRNMDFEASGSYACVVSTQTPIYTKPSNEHELTVIRKCTFPAQVVRTANNTTLLSNPFTMQ
jgi:cytochrome bd-type quinol oxidase subunit 2